MIKISEQIHKRLKVASALEGLKIKDFSEVAIERLLSVIEKKRGLKIDCN